MALGFMTTTPAADEQIPVFLQSTVIARRLGQAEEARQQKSRGTSAISQEEPHHQDKMSGQEEHEEREGDERVARGYTIWLRENYPTVDINVDTWGDDIESNSLSRAQIMGHLLYFMEWAAKENWRDEELFEELQSWFKDFSLEIFKAMIKAPVTKLMHYLMSKGVRVPYNPKSTSKHAEAKAIHDLINIEEMLPWTPDLIRKQEQKRIGLDSRFATQPQSQQQSAPRSRTPPPQESPAAIPTPVSDRDPAPAANGPLLQNAEVARQMREERDNTAAIAAAARASAVEKVRTPEEVAKESDRKVDTVNKYYGYATNKEKIYTGDEYQFLHKKLNIFDDQCRRLNDDEKCAAFPAMLGGKANTYYYETLAGRGHKFIDLASKVQAKFETNARRVTYISKWRDITLPKIQQNNPDKGLVDCFDILIEELEKTQPGLAAVNLADRPNLPTMLKEDYAKETLLIACADIKETNMAKFHDPGDYEDTMTKLRESITSSTKPSATSAYLTGDQYPMDNLIDMGSGTWMVERTFHPGKSQYPYGGGNRGTFNRGTFGGAMRGFGGGYRGGDNGAYRGLRRGRGNGFSGLFR